MTDRRTASTITDTELDQLYERLESAEAALARIRALADRWGRDAPPPGNKPLTELRAALDEPAAGPAATQTTDRKEQPGA